MCPAYMSQMCILAGIQHHVTRVTRDSDITELLRNSLLMIIYDKDKNNEPSTRHGGERAHWLLITGFCYKTPSSTHRTPSLRGHIGGTHSPAMGHLGGVRSLPENNFIGACARLGKDVELHVFVQHGKSRLRQLWRWRDILESNETVRQPKPGDWVVPENFHSQVADIVVRVPVEL